MTERTKGGRKEAKNKRKERKNKRLFFLKSALGNLWLPTIFFTLPT